MNRFGYALVGLVLGSAEGVLFVAFGILHWLPWLVTALAGGALLLSGHRHDETAAYSVRMLATADRATARRSWAVTDQDGRQVHRGN